jgi:CheY-like chemotaxis protein
VLPSQPAGSSVNVYPLSQVLIIDDEPDGCAAVAAYLTKAGHAARWVPNGREALDAIAEQVPDAILLDVRMPGMDGLAVLQVIRSYLRWTAVPIAILTAYPEDPRLWHVAEHGVTRVFAKAKFNLDEVLQWVEQQAGRAQSPPELEPPSSQAGI